MNLFNAGTQVQVQSQKQKLVLTAEMKESLEILQMPMAELQKKIEETVLENPVMELDESYRPEVSSLMNERPVSDGAEDMDEEPFDLKRFKNLSDFTSIPVSCGAGSKDDFNPLLFLSEKMTFSDYLINQIAEFKVSPEIARICRYIIGNLDEKGYLVYGVEEIAGDLKLPVEFAADALKIVQQMEPAGVGARSLCECLTLQLLRQSDCNPVILQIITQHMELLAENKIQVIAQKVHVPVKTVQEYCSRIRRLNPVPSSGFNTNTEEILAIPEAVVKKDENGTFVVEFNNHLLSSLSISNYYLKMADQTDDKATEKYLKTKIRQAASFMQELTFRKKTIVRVLEKIVELQRGYFESGKAFLSPMSIMDLAQQLDLSESTISRAIQNKYILCQYGAVSLRALFTSKVKSSDQNEDFSSSYVKGKIKDLITNENKNRPLSDQNICDNLNLFGMIISRRTVAKYRDEMRIPSAARRRYFDAGQRS